jgi:hypothetical protein
LNKARPRAFPQAATLLSPRYPLFPAPFPSRSALNRIAVASASSASGGHCARRAKWKPYAPSPPLPSPRRPLGPIVSPRGCCPRGALGHSGRHRRPAPSPPPARRLWYPARRLPLPHRPRTPARSTARAGSAAPAPPASSLCESRSPNLRSSLSFRVVIGRAESLHLSWVAG